MEKILCVGLGKLGLIFSQILAASGYKVIGYDINLKIKKSIENNENNLEPYLNKLIKKNRKNFYFEQNIKSCILNSNIAFLVLPTPSKKNGEFSNQYILNFIDKICRYLKNKKKYIINITSTVNPGSCEFFIKYIEKKYKLKHGKEFLITYNPHLIAIGSIYNDVINSDVVLVGSNLKFGHTFLKKIYNKIYKKKNDKVKYLNLKEAEIAKITINSYVTMKISYTNTISQIADTIKNINTAKIFKAIGFDKRIGHKYLSLGALYSGPCFPRDNINFGLFLKKNKLDNSLPLIVDKINNLQLKRYIKIFKDNKHTIKKPIIIGICGLSYKPNSDIVTKSPGYLLMKYFEKKFKVLFYDEYISRPIKNQVSSLKELFDKSNFLFLCYKDKNFKKLEQLKSKNQKIIVDMWNYIKIKDKHIQIKKIGISY